MKQIFRSLTLAVMALVSGSAFAGDWSIPTPAFQELASGDTVYVYNVGQQAFFNQGEAWGTEAVVSKTAGLPCIMEAQTDGTYKLKNNSTKGWAWAKRVNGDTKAGAGNRTLFVDGAESANNTFTVTALGGNVYSICMASNGGDADEYTTLVGEMGEGNFLVGVQPDHASQYVIDNSLTETAALWYDVAPSANTQWAFVAKAVYEAWAAKADLLALMNEAETRSVSTADAEAVLNNASSTLEEVNAAITALTQAIANAVTPDNPRDASSLIKENDFEGGSHAAWTVTVLGGAGSDGKIQNVTIATNRCEDADANVEGVFDGHFFEGWDPSAYSAHMYQKVEGVPSGVYKAELAAFVNTADPDNATNQTQYVFFNDTKVALQANTLNHNYTSFVFIDADTLNIGLAQDSVIANWMGIDNAKLTYYGSGIDAYTYYAKQVYDGTEIPEGSTYNESYKTALDEAYATATSAATIEDAIAAAKAVSSAYNALMNNISAYSKLATAVEKLETYLNSGYPLDDEWERAADMLDNATATTEDVLAEIASDEAAIESALKNNYSEGDVVTDIFITNPTFSNATETTAASAMSTKGWTAVSGTIGGNANVAEAYNCSFNLYQDLTKMKKGAYKIEIQGFYRTTSGKGDNGAAGSNTGPAWDNWVNASGADEGDNKIYSYVYAGALETPFNNLFSWEGRSEGDGSNWQLAGNGYYLPNDVTSAYEAFSEDNQYSITLTAIPVANKMRLGLKNTRPSNASQWTIWNDFKLTYLGTSADVTAPALTALLAIGDEAAAKNMTAAHKEALNSAISTSNSAVAGSDGDAIVAAYEALSGAIDDANTSIVYYDTLVTKADELQLAVDSKAETAKEEALTAANNLLAEVNAGIAAGSYSIEEAKAMFTAIDNAIEELNVPKGEASDNNPLDYTFKITNPGYTDNSTSGWTISKIKDLGSGSTSASNNVLEGWNVAFETYQDITGLPQGTYRIDVKAAFRTEAADSASKHTLAGDIDLRGYMFAGTGEDYSALDSALLKNIVVLDASLSANGSESSWSKCIDSTDVNNPIVYWFPNTRDAARDRFDNTTVYDNSLYATVGADGQLRIGVFNHNVKKNDWLLFSDWKLYYLGTNSAHATETGINTISGKVANREYFTIDGRKVNVLNKGLNIIRESDANGNVTIKKVIVK